MPEIRINNIPTTAASTASDDFFAIDGSNNNTRKMSAYSPTFGGNLTVSGTGNNVFRGPIRWGNTNWPGYNGYISEASTDSALIPVIARNLIGSTGSNYTIANGDLGYYSGFELGTDIRWFAASGTFTTGQSLVPTERMRLTYQGNLLLGATTDLNRLTVFKDAAGSDIGAGDGQVMIAGATNTNKRLAIGFNTTSDYGWLQAGIAGTAYKNIVLNNNGGNVLIGTTTDGGQKLQVSGAIAATTGGANNGIIARYSSTANIFGITINSSGQSVLSENVDASSGSDKYSTTGYPSFRLGNVGGSGTTPFWVDVAASGTSGNAITWTNALRIDNAANATFAGKITAGTWAHGTAEKLQANTTANNYAGFFVNTASSGNGYALRLHTNGTTSGDYPLFVSSGAGAGSLIFGVTGDGNATFAGNLTVSGTGVSTFGTTGKTAIQQVASSGALATGGWIYGLDEGLNFSPNGAGLNKKLVMAYWDGSSYRSALEFSNVSSGTATLKLSDYGGLTTVGGNLTVSGGQALTIGSSANYSLWKDGTPTKAGRVILNNAVTNGLSLGLYDGSSWVDTLHIHPTNNNVLIGTNVDGGQKLQVAGTALVSGDTTVGGTLYLDKTIPLLELREASVVKAQLYTASGALTLQTNTANSITLATNSTTALTLDSSQNATFAASLTTVGRVLNTSVKTANYTVATSNHVIICNSASAFTITMIAASSNTGRQFIIKNKGAGEITVDATSLGQIDGLNTITLSQYQSTMLVSDGTTWNRI